MATPTANPAIATVGTKRKRNQVSYAVNDYYDSMAIDVDEDTEESDVDEDDEFGSRKKAGKGRAKKKAKTSSKGKEKKKNEKPFRFLDLPAELRDEIYDLALYDPDGITLVSRTKKYRRSVTRGAITTEDGDYYYGKQRRRSYWYRRGASNSQTSDIGTTHRQFIPNLLAVNKQIRSEATPILYKQELILEDTSALHTFIAQIGPYNRQLLSKVTVKGWGKGRGVQKGHNFAALTILASCSNIKELFLDCSIGWHRDPKWLARQVFRDGHYFMEAFGAANGHYDAAVDIIRVADKNLDKGHTGRWSGHRPNSEAELDPKKQDEFEEELRVLLSAKS